MPRSPCCGGIFDWDTAQKRVAELNQRAEDPALWNDPAAAQKIMRERTHLQHAIDEYGRLERSVDDALTLAELGEAEGDGSC